LAFGGVLGVRAFCDAQLVVGWGAEGEDLGVGVADAWRASTGLLDGADLVVGEVALLELGGDLVDAGLGECG